MTYQEIETALTEIDILIVEPIEQTSAEQMTRLASELNAIQSLSSTLVAESLKVLRADELYQLSENQHLYSKPSILSKIVSASTGDTQALHEKCRRMNSAVVTKIEYLRTALSLYKTEFALTFRDSGGNL